MLSLKRPVSKEDEDRRLRSILKKPHFASCAALWKQAYDDYRKMKGNPWLINSASFSSTTKARQIALYETRKNGGPLKRIRQTPDLLCCPMCGSPSIGTLDHYLPKEDYPEFSVLPSNLLPACSLCNSGAKGRTYKGALSGERFIHPYFDKLGDGPIWKVNVQQPYAAATFNPVPVTPLSSKHALMMLFHLREIFGPTFHTQMGTYWSGLPTVVASHIQEFNLSFSQALAIEEKWSSQTLGLNGWRTALIRGIKADPAAEAYLDNEVSKLNH
jgi:5-methylcytosine-specific restriction endonuclease McrA